MFFVCVDKCNPALNLDLVCLNLRCGSLKKYASLAKAVLEVKPGTKATCFLQLIELLSSLHCHSGAMNLMCQLIAHSACLTLFVIYVKG